MIDGNIYNWRVRLLFTTYVSETCNEVQLQDANFVNLSIFVKLLFQCPDHVYNITPTADKAKLCQDNNSRSVPPGVSAKQLPALYL